jgi:hypothetical protein
MKPCVLWAAVVIVIAHPLRADEWQAPTPKIFASEGGRHAFKVLDPHINGRCEGVLFRLDADGKEQIAWRTKLVNTPYRVRVDDAGKFVVTIDTYGNLGYEHSLVIYDIEGKVIRDFKLEELLTADEIKTKVKQTESSRWWAKNADLRVERGQLSVRLAWGKDIRVELATGKISESR